MTALRNFFTRISRAMSSAPQRQLTEAELRALSHEQLLTYTLQHIHSSSATPSKRPAPQAQPTYTADEQPTSISQSKKKKRKTFDMSRYGQRMIALRLVYTGWRFHGFSTQVTSENTVEHHLFAALLKTRLIESRETCQYSRSGRTDVGVSALGQVIGLRIRSNVVPPSSAKTELDFVKVINGNLPSGIRILAWAPVSDGTSAWPKTYSGDPEAARKHWAAYESGEKVADKAVVRRPGAAFSARFDAIYRSYKYFFVRGDLDIEAMRAAAKMFQGSHDFRNFCRIDENVTSFERLMYTVDIRRVSGDDTGEGEERTMYYIFVKGQAFLWHQVRCMAAVLFDVGMGREEPSIIERMLVDARSGRGKFGRGRPQYRMASPIPLLLYECAYPDSVVAFPQKIRMRGSKPEQRGDDDELELQQSQFDRVDTVLSKCYAELATQCSIVGAMLSENDKFRSADGQDRTFGERGWKRNFLLDLNKGRHVAYDDRACDDSLEVKLERAAEKKRKKEMAM